MRPCLLWLLLDLMIFYTILYIAYFTEILSPHPRFALNKKLRGVMIWSIDTDDFHGDCSPETDTFIDYFNDLNALKQNPFYREAFPELDIRNS